MAITGDNDNDYIMQWAYLRLHRSCRRLAGCAEAQQWETTVALLATSRAGRSLRCRPLATAIDGPPAPPHPSPPLQAAPLFTSHSDFQNISVCCHRKPLVVIYFFSHRQNIVHRYHPISFFTSLKGEKWGLAGLFCWNQSPKALRFEF